MIISISEQNDDQAKHTNRKRRKKCTPQHKQNKPTYPLYMLPPIDPIPIHLLLRMRCIGREDRGRQRENVREGKKTRV
jgi:hypothetical protein